MPPAPPGRAAPRRGCRTRSGLPEVEHRDLLGHVHHQLHHVLDEQDRHPQSRAPGGCAGPDHRSPVRLMPAAGSSSSSSAGRAAAARANSRRRCSPNARLDASSSPLCARSASSSSPAISFRVRRVAPNQRGRKPLPGDVPGRVLRHPQVLPHREVREQADVLEGACNPGSQALVRRLPVHQLPAEVNGAGGRRVDAADHVDRGALARAVGSDQAEDLALGDGQVQPVEGPDSRRSASSVR